MSSSKFVDVNGVEWTLRLTVGMLADIKREAKFDLGEALKSETALAGLFEISPGKLVELLWVMCETQAIAKGVSPQQFGYSFDGATVGAATEALLMAIADFFPRAKVARAIRANLPELLDKMDTHIIQQMTNKTSKAFVGN